MFTAATDKAHGKEKGGERGRGAEISGSLLHLQRRDIRVTTCKYELPPRGHSKSKPRHQLQCKNKKSFICQLLMQTHYSLFESFEDNAA